MANIDINQARREGMRWYLLKALYNAKPLGAMDVLLRDVMSELYGNATPNEIKSELNYLYQHGLVNIKDLHNGHVNANLTHHGVDFVEYNCKSLEGIARPEKTWE